MTIRNPVPVIDLFAGPGGLGEGFASVVDENGVRRFSLKVSIEKDPVAHRTLSLRALFRAFPKDNLPGCYFDYIRGGGGISRDVLFSHPSISEEARLAAEEAKHAELGKTDPGEIDKWIEEALCGADEWALIGGPPCQAYSIAGRSRRTKEATDVFESDEKHFLYKEYLRIIQKFRPSVFVMENVKGILSSTHGGSGIFRRILTDLSSPLDGLEYRIRSFVVPGQGNEIKPNDFIIESERFGLPQRRHRVILFGIRSDLADGNTALTISPEQFVLNPSTNTVSVAEALSGLPPLRSRLSREVDTHAAWLSTLKSAERELRLWQGGASHGHGNGGGPGMCGGRTSCFLRWSIPEVRCSHAAQYPPGTSFMASGSPLGRRHSARDAGPHAIGSAPVSFCLVFCTRPPLFPKARRFSAFIPAEP
jgi:DNA (cytosine-5)-methyltransferase 1